MASAYIFIKVQAGKIRDAVQEISKIEGVKSVHACWGQPGDLIAFVEAPDHKALADLVLAKIHGIDGVTETNTRIVVEV
ncbi:MAG: Lrp/AsnC ligand binding domain-containing protein [Actinomycetota bacterium]|nr:Lrp/AsnC ligand binding domain-containing protein [Actinomycetota bacterium]MDI6822567.1 Lrp/AsnC ligand binding domain-containing protein [Actinomycetota bacterium]